MSDQPPVTAAGPPTNSMWDVIKQSIRDFIDDAALSQAAAVSFYMLFSMAPLLVIVVSIAGFVWEPQQVSGQLVSELGGIIGPAAGDMLEEIIAKASQRRQSGVIATVAGVLTLLIGALGCTRTTKGGPQHHLGGADEAVEHGMELPIRCEQRFGILNSGLTLAQPPFIRSAPRRSTP